MLVPLNPLKRKLSFALFMAILQSSLLFGQINNAFPCYAIAKNANLEDVFYKYENTTHNWVQTAKSSNTNITALSSNPVTKVMYAINGQSFGTINPVNGVFNAVAHINKTLNGQFGAQTMSAVKSIAYDVAQQEIYAIHRLNNQRDVIFVINPENGEIVHNRFTDDTTNDLVDYRVVDELDFNGQLYNNTLDMAIDPQSGQLYLVYGHNEEFCLVVADKTSGLNIAPLLEIKDKYVRNLTFSSQGKLHIVAKDKASNESHVFQIDQFAGSMEAISKVEEDANIQFTAIEFQKPFHDLALKIEESPNQTQPVMPGDVLTFDIEIINQGEIEVNYIQIVNYLSSGLTLNNENGWLFSDDFTLLDITEQLLPKQSLKRQIQFTVNEDFTGTIANFAEVNLYVNSFSDYGLPMAWPDIDSFADNSNEELIYKDNEVAENGMRKTEDEDDHDVVVLSIGTSCTAQLSFTDTAISSSIYQVGHHIYVDNSTVANGTIFKAGSAIIINNGFDVASHTNFEMKIGACD